MKGYPILCRVNPVSDYKHYKCAADCYLLYVLGNDKCKEKNT